MEMPVWLGDFTTMVLASTSTAVSALFAMISPLSTVLMLVFKVARWIVSSCSIQSNVLGPNAKVLEVFGESAKNVKDGAGDEMEANLEEEFDEPEDEEMPSQTGGHTNDHAVQDTEEEEEEEEFIQNRTRAGERFLTRWDQHAVALCRP